MRGFACGMGRLVAIGTRLREGLAWIAFAWAIACLSTIASANVWPSPKHGAHGELLPARPWREVIDRGMDFILDDLNGWAKGNSLTDEAGVHRPPYFFYSLAIDGRHEGAGQFANADTAYPAFHHAIFIETFLDYYELSKRSDALKAAKDLADWEIAHQTPADFKYAYLPYSTIHRGKLGGSIDGNSIMTDKPAIMAAAYLRLARVTGNKIYRRAAQRIAQTLARTQLPAGNWPFRVDPRDGRVIEAYTSSVIYAVELFEQLDAEGEHQFAEPRRRALAWLLNGPVKTMEWRGFYEDIPGELSLHNRTNWDCIDTARYLIRHRADDPAFLPTAIKLHDWIRQAFVDEKTIYAPAEPLREQLVCNIAMGIHSGHWAMLLADLYQATGQQPYRDRAVNIAAYITLLQQPDGRIPVGRDWDEAHFGWWYSCHFGALRYLMELKLP